MRWEWHWSLIDHYLETGLMSHLDLDKMCEMDDGRESGHWRIFRTRASEQSRSRSWCCRPELTRRTQPRSPYFNALVVFLIMLLGHGIGFLGKSCHFCYEICHGAVCVPTFRIYQETAKIWQVTILEYTKLRVMIEYLDQVTNTICWLWVLCYDNDNNTWQFLE